MVVTTVVFMCTELERLRNEWDKQLSGRLRRIQHGQKCSLKNRIETLQFLASHCHTALYDTLRGVPIVLMLRSSDMCILVILETYRSTYSKAALSLEKVRYVCQLEFARNLANCTFGF